MAAVTEKLSRPEATLVNAQRRAAIAQAAVLLLIACVGATHLAYPFGGDQALFALGAGALHHGSVLYRDFWDLKQPAIFLFYLTGGSVFGFTEIGIHLFELLYFIAFSLVLQTTLRSQFRYGFSSAVAPLLIVGVYYATATQLSLTQVEALTGFPLYLCAYFALRGAQTGRARYFIASGIAGAVVVCFKLLFMPLLIVLWAVAAFKTPFRNAAILLGTFAVAVAAWLGATAALAGQKIVFDTFFVYPMQISRIMPTAPLHRLVDSIGTYALGVALVIVLAAIGAARGDNPWKALCAAWIAGGAFVILLQRQSWWKYQLDLFDVPLGILAAFGIDTFCKWREEEPAHRARPVNALAAIVLVLLTLPTLRHQAATMRDLARSGFARDAQAQQHFQTLIDPHDRTIAQTRFLLGSTALPGDIYICGNPRYYLAANRRQAVSINGWSMELLLPQQWKQLTLELEDKRPGYMFVDQYYRKLIPSRSPAMAREIAARYRLLRSGTLGDWYERR